VVRAIVEGLNYQLLDIVSAMETCLGARMEQFTVVGGATRNAFWMQNKADVLGRPIEVPEIEEATPLGAAILAGIGVGLYRDEQDAFRRVYRPGRVYRPDPARAALYADGYRIYKQLYQALAPVSHQLFDRFVTG
jgi:xylulokinase